MTRSFALVLMLLSVYILGCSDDGIKIPSNPHINNPNYEYELVNIVTNRGAMLLWLSYQTPKHQENFLQLVKDGFYEGLTFHRVVRDFVIQGGDPNGNGTGGAGYTIEAEIKTRLRHRYGAIGAARSGGSTNPRKRSNGSQFYIVSNFNGAHFLNGDYTVFGQLVSGTTTVNSINGVTTNQQEMPTSPIIMSSVTIVKYTAQQLLDQFSFDIAEY